MNLSILMEEGRLYSSFLKHCTNIEKAYPFDLRYTDISNHFQMLRIYVLGILLVPYAKKHGLSIHLATKLAQWHGNNDIKASNLSGSTMIGYLTHVKTVGRVELRNIRKKVRQSRHIDREITGLHQSPESITGTRYGTVMKGPSVL